jgi:hypothetical protein
MIWNGLKAEYEVFPAMGKRQGGRSCMIADYFRQLANGSTWTFISRFHEAVASGAHKIQLVLITCAAAVPIA